MASSSASVAMAIAMALSTSRWPTSHQRSQWPPTTSACAQCACCIYTPLHSTRKFTLAGCALVGHSCSIGGATSWAGPIAFTARSNRTMAMLCSSDSGHAESSGQWNCCCLHHTCTHSLTHVAVHTPLSNLLCGCPHTCESLRRYRRQHDYHRSVLNGRPTPHRGIWPHSLSTFA
jgi:hypothetical protein